MWLHRLHRQDRSQIHHGDCEHSEQPKQRSVTMGEAASVHLCSADRRDGNTANDSKEQPRNGGPAAATRTARRTAALAQSGHVC